MNSSSLRSKSQFLVLAIFANFCSPQRNLQESANSLSFLGLCPQNIQIGLAVIDNGHADYCVLCATSLLHDNEPDVIEAQRVLNIESKAKAESAYYFLALLDASTTKGENIETIISNFTKFFEAHKLGALRRHIAGWGTPYWDRFHPLFWSRCMLDSLVLKTLCP